MRRLIEVTDNQKLHTSTELQQDYANSRLSLQDHVKSVKNYNHLNKELKIKLDSCTTQLESLLRFKTEKVPRRCQVDYFGVMLEDLLVGVIAHFKSLSEICQVSMTKGKFLKDKAKQTLLGCQKDYSEKTQNYEKIVKDFVEAVYPDTKGVLFKLHMKSPEKVQKRPDTNKEDQMDRDANNYNEALEDILGRLDDGVRSISEHCEHSLYAFRDGWIRSTEALNAELSQVRVEDQDIEVFMDEVRVKRKKEGRSRSRGKSVRGSYQ